jgi:hypothetical protein
VQYADSIFLRLLAESKSNVFIPITSMNRVVIFHHIRMGIFDLSSVASPVLDHIHETNNNNHSVSIDSLSILRELRKLSQLDAYET